MLIGKVIAPKTASRCLLSMTSTTKRTLFGTLTALAILVAFDAVYLLGYRHGMEEGIQKERQAWTSRGATYSVVGPTGRGASPVLNTVDPSTYRALGLTPP